MKIIKDFFTSLRMSIERFIATRMTDDQLFDEICKMLNTENYLYFADLNLITMRDNIHSVNQGEVVIAGENVYFDELRRRFEKHGQWMFCLIKKQYGEWGEAKKEYSQVGWELDWNGVILAKGGIYND
jgi:hypothetical protein